MSAIDFANSYMTWFPEDEGANAARIQLDAACTIVDEATGQSKTSYLIAPCRSERCHLDTRLFTMPNYEFCAIWSDDDFMIVRTHWASQRDNRRYGGNRELWSDVRLDVRQFAHAEVLPGNAEIVAATLANRPLIARTEIHNPQTRQRAILEYPVNTMNVLRQPPGFQVDTGPLIVPDFSSTASHQIERFDMAYVVYNVFTKAEFIRRKPLSIGEDDHAGPETTDYSAVDVLAARNEVMAAT